MSEENTGGPVDTKAKAPKKAPKKAKAPARAGKMTDAQVDRFIASYAKDRDLSIAAATRAIVVRGVQRLATLSRWQDKQS